VSPDSPHYLVFQITSFSLSLASAQEFHRFFTLKIKNLDIQILDDRGCGRAGTKSDSGNNFSTLR
jgi:hypothetical protein